MGGGGADAAHIKNAEPDNHHKMLSVFLASPSYVMPMHTMPSAGSARMAMSQGEELLLSKFGLPGPEEYVTSRRTALGLGAVASAAMLPFMGAAPAMAEDGMFAVPPLPYAYDALEPHIDAATMKFHHDFHHQAYVNNLNKAMAGKPAASLVSLMPGAKGAKLNNAGGGHYNHCLFWTIMGPNAGGEPTGTLGEKMNAAFGSYDEFKTQFSAAAAGVFGSGWAWLAVAKDGSVSIVTTPNQDNPLVISARVLRAARPI